LHFCPVCSAAEGRIAAKCKEADDRVALAQREVETVTERLLSKVCFGGMEQRDSLVMFRPTGSLETVRHRVAVLSSCVNSSLSRTQQDMPSVIYI